MFAALWLVALALAQVRNARRAGGLAAAVRWTVIFLTLAAGGIIVAGIASVPGQAAVCVVVSGLLAAIELACRTTAKSAEATAKENAARERLLHMEQKLHLHIEQTPLGVIELDLDGRVAEWNTAAERIFGHAREEVIGKDFRSLIVPESTREKVDAVWAGLMRGATEPAHMQENFTKDGRTILCEWSNTPIRDSNGGVSGVSSLCEDITEKHRAAREIENLAAFPRYNPNAVMQFSEQGELVYFNESTEEMAKSLGKQKVPEILPPDVAVAVRECLESGGNQVRRETKVSQRTISWAFFPIPAVRCVHCYASDVTERLNLEQQLRQSQKMQSVGQLAAGVAHDFNNVLTIIQGHCELVAVGQQLSKSGVESLEQIRMASDRAAKLTQQLLTFGRKQFMQMELLDINEVIQRVTGMLRRVLGENISLRSNLAPRLPAVEADATMMEQVIMNLSVNARDAMPGGGSLTIGTVPVMVSRAYVERNPEAREGTFICLSVSDNGTGIESDKLGKLFEPFFTTKEVGKGTGLGLATVYGIVKQHQGWIEVESELGKGSVFKVYLPSSVKAVQARNGKVAPQNVRGGKETVLLVEDEAGVLSLARGVLKSYGYDVLEAHSGVEALRVWAQHDTRIDLLLTDIVMPEGMSGLDLARKLRQEKHDLKVLYSSGYSIEVAGQDFGLTDGMAFLKKPYQPTALAQKVRECLDLPA
ncbi:MAG TPA: PAS domain S-box protein [Chthoniobacteraceae bacterium]|nr:PAS domain S-box protein [Chthoniobacteraceae bacterium]